MRRYMLHHMCLLTERAVANITHEWLLSGVDFQMLLEIKPLTIDQQPTNWTTLIFRPVIVHVKVKVLQVSSDDVTFNALDRPLIVLDFDFVI